MAASLTAAVISCDAAEEQLQEKQLSAAGVISCNIAVWQLLVKTLDEMLEFEPSEDVGDLVHGGALLLHLHPGGEQAAAHRLVPLFLAAQLHLIAIKRQGHSECFGFGENVALIPRGIHLFQTNNFFLSKNAFRWFKKPCHHHEI
jgi:hypothetical protein